MYAELGNNVSSSMITARALYSGNSVQHKHVFYGQLSVSWSEQVAVTTFHQLREFVRVLRNKTSILTIHQYCDTLNKAKLRCYRDTRN